MKKVLAVVSSLCLIAGTLAGCTSAAQTTDAAAGGATGSDTVIALITMDSIDQHWVTLNEGRSNV